MPLRIGLLTTWNTRCGIAEYSRQLAEALRRHDDVELVVLGSRNHGDRAVAPYEEWATPVFDVQVWHPELRFELDVDAVLERELDVLHIQYAGVFYSWRRLADLLRRFPGVLAITYHDKGGLLGFPHGRFDLRYTHRSEVGAGPRRVIPQGLDLRPPVVKTFGLGRSRDDLIGAMCERNGWDFQHSFGEKRWLDGEELRGWVRDCDAVVLWYDENRRAGASAGAPLAISTRRPVYVNDTAWFRDLPDDVPNLRKLRTIEQLEVALREQFANPFAEESAWGRIAGSLLDDYREALRARRESAPSRESGASGRLYAALDRKPLRRVALRPKSLLRSG